MALGKLRAGKDVWHVKSTTAARDSAYSEVEHEDEVYSARQLATRDCDLVKSETTLPVLVAIGGAGTPDLAGQDAVLDEEAADSAVDDESNREDLPLAVTASIFHSAGEKDKEERENVPRKGNVLPEPIQEKAFVQTLKKSLEESIKESLDKENDKPPAPEKRQNCRSFGKTPFVFQVSLRRRNLVRKIALT